MVYFVDTSGLAKRYINEQGSSWVINWIAPAAGNIIIVSAITSVEMFSVFARREREKAISPGLSRIVRNDFLFHLENEYLSIEIDSFILARSRDLINTYPLRTLDALQLACAIHAKTSLNAPIAFISADTNLLLAATTEGFITDNPNLH